MKNKVKCPNGHFYNADTFDACPICGTIGEKEIEDQADIYDNQKPPSKIGKAFGAVKKKTENTGTSAPPVPGGGGWVNPTRNNVPVQGVAWEDYENAKTSALFVDGDAEDKKEKGNMGEKFVYVPPEVSSREPDAPTPASIQLDKTPEPEPEPPVVHVPPVIAPDNKENDSKTYAVWVDDAGTGLSPVCGWIVCINGAYKGKSFEIKSGNNNIGRDADMDIVLADEPTVSRNKHGIITYDSKGRSFYVQQGESSGTTYLNEKIVFTPTELKSADKIEVGNAAFLFVAFCNEKFSWEENI